MNRLEGLVACVTGGGSGLGRAITKSFVEEGAKVASLHRSRESSERLRRDFGDAVLPLEGDVRSREDNVRFVDAAIERFGKLDVFVANAAVWDFGKSLTELPDAVFADAVDEVLGINVKGPLLGAKASAEALIASRGSMIFTVSNAGFYPGGGGPLYTASKHAVVGIVRQLACELAPRVRVNGVAPGGMVTELRGPRALGLEDERVSPEVLKHIFETQAPLQFLPEPADYTGAYVYLAARGESATATGVIINCDVGLGVRGLS